MKTCSKCGVTKDESEFYLRGDSVKRRADCGKCNLFKNKGYRRKNRARIANKDAFYRKANREKIAARKREYWKKNSGRATDVKRNSKYGIAPGEFERMFSAQDGGCAICAGPGGKKGLGIDHDHKSKKVRSLLCSNCNSAIGLLKDSSVIAQLATDYLKQHGK